MAWFSTKHFEKLAVTRTLLQSIPLLNCKHNYLVNVGEEEDKRESSPVYALFVDVFNATYNLPVGLFNDTEGVINVHVGFSYKKGFLRRDYFELNQWGSLYVPKDAEYSYGEIREVTRAPRNEEVFVYLPLVKTQFFEAIGKHEDGKFTPNEGSPFQILGINGDQGVHPLIIATETAEGIKTRGFCVNADTPFTYNESRVKGLDNLVDQMCGRPVRVVVEKKNQKSEDNKSSPSVDVRSPKQTVAELDKTIIKQDAAKRLGWGRNTLTRKLKELNYK